MRYRHYRNTIGAVHGDKVVDPIFMGLVEHHAQSEADRQDMIDFMFARGGSKALGILVRHLGRREPLLIEQMAVDTWGDRQIIGMFTLKADLSLYWRENALFGTQLLPETVLSALPGRPVGTLVEHPYIPVDLVIDRVEQDWEKWKATFRVQSKKGKKP